MKIMLPLLLGVMLLCAGPTDVRQTTSDVTRFLNRPREETFIERNARQRAEKAEAAARPGFTWRTVGMKADPNFRGLWSLPDEVRKEIQDGVPTPYWSMFDNAVSMEHLMLIREYAMFRAKGDWTPERVRNRWLVIAALITIVVIGAIVLPTAIRKAKRAYRPAAVSVISTGIKAGEVTSRAVGAARGHLDGLIDEAKKMRQKKDSCNGEKVREVEEGVD
jgi:hypothetical protein